MVSRGHIERGGIAGGGVGIGNRGSWGAVKEVMGRGGSTTEVGVGACPWAMGKDASQPQPFPEPEPEREREPPGQAIGKAELLTDDAGLTRWRSWPLCISYVQYPWVFYMSAFLLWKIHRNPCAQSLTLTRRVRCRTSATMQYSNRHGTSGACRGPAFPDSMLYQRRPG